MVRRYGSTFDDYAVLYDHTDPEASIRGLISIGEGRAVEFKSTMRMNLHTGKAGKEIGMAWLKAVAVFLNTDGCILLLGVTDSSEINGPSSDELPVSKVLTYIKHHK